MSTGTTGSQPMWIHEGGSDQGGLIGCGGKWGGEQVEDSGWKFSGVMVVWEIIFGMYIDIGVGGWRSVVQAGCVRAVFFGIPET